MKSLPRIILLTILLCFLPNVAYAQTSYKVTAPKVNVRNKPSSQALVVGVVNQGDVIEVSSVTNGWATLLFKGKDRYIDAQYIEPVIRVEGPTEKPKKKKSKKQDELTDSTVTPSPSNLSQFKNRVKKGEKESPDRTRDVDNGQSNLIVDIYGGYSNFRCKEVSPKAGIGFGVDIGIQSDCCKLWGKIPCGLFGEITLGYSCRGSGAFPIHYAGARILPFGYKYSINSDWSVVGKAGMYLAYPFSKIKMRDNSYSTNFDFGVSVGLGVEWKKLGFMATYEHGLTDVKNGGLLKLYNQGVFFVLSYKLWSF